MSIFASLAELLTQACERRPDAIAIESPEGHFTYHALLANAKQIAVSLSERGITTNEPVHVRVSNRPADFAALFSVWIAGGVAVPVHRTAPSDAVARIREKTQARLQLDVSSLKDPSDDSVQEIGSSEPPANAQLSQAALIVFTSGSTGSPKGVVVTHEALASKLLASDALVHFRHNERSLLLLNITFSFGLWLSLLTMIGSGTLVIVDQFDASLLLDQLKEHRINRIGVVPTMLRALFAQCGAQECADAPMLLQIITAGEPLNPQFASRTETFFPQADLINIYGLTETCTSDFFQFPNQRHYDPLGLGVPSSNVRFRVVDELQKPVLVGEVGELQILSPYLMRGYLDDPELTVAAFSGEWFRTGDLALVTPSSGVQLMGRRKELIVRGGNKITPVEIEQAVMSLDGVVAAMAVGVPDDILGERIHVLIVPAPGQQPNFVALREQLLRRLEKFKVPDVFYCADLLPVGRTGKADRREMRAMITDGTLLPLHSTISTTIGKQSA